VPGLDEALRFEEDGLLGVFLSGAGPSIAALTLGSSTGVQSQFTQLYARLGLHCAVRRLEAHQPPAARTLLGRAGHALAPHTHTG
jgi:homoserine kinase